ncbi:hypothetical protein B0H16DRAFT_1719949 [Mycena metata]|uniref:CHCH domain-containing protein n=1 Tax=Mycena metata TaxID=1033252 RepID=A0AAD7JA04_9AGAR|nr:hypothetical protein B0H16DRAFT_1719949 [Mycena metata]
MSQPSPLPHPHDNVEPLDYKEQFQGQEPSKFVDPCDGASKASFKCMDQNNYDRTACMDYFQAYRDCKAAWLERRKDDRRNGRPDSKT